MHSLVESNHSLSEQSWLHFGAAQGVKAFYRRAMAREKLNRVDDALKAIHGENPHIPRQTQGDTKT